MRPFRKGLDCICAEENGSGNCSRSDSNSISRGGEMKWWRCLSNKNKKGWVGKLGSCPNGQANWTNHVSIRLCVNTCLCVSAELWFYFVHFMYYNVPYALIKYVGMWVITKHSKALSFFGNICQIVELKCCASVTEFAFEPFNYYKITYRSTCTPYKSKYQWWYLNQYWPVQVVKYHFFLHRLQISVHH